MAAGLMHPHRIPCGRSGAAQSIWNGVRSEEPKAALAMPRNARAAATMLTGHTSERTPSFWQEVVSSRVARIQLRGVALKVMVMVMVKCSALVRSHLIYLVVGSFRPKTQSLYLSLELKDSES